MIQGFATLSGTKRYASRHSKALEAGHFRLASDLMFSSVGLGTYLGDPNEETDARSYEAAQWCLTSGVNVIDSAINYRAQRSERVIGRLLKDLVAKNLIRRDEVFISTKGGFIPFDSEYSQDPHEYLSEHFIKSGILSEKEVVQGCHAMTPKYLENQLELSLKNLGLQTIDLYHLHNPETQLEERSEDEFYSGLRKAFEFLEGKVIQGKIKMYGTATWNGCRVPKETQGYLSLAKILETAVQAGGEGHHLKAIQLPYNLGMPEALANQNQSWQEESVSAIEWARRVDLLVFASASLLQGRLTQRLPDKIRSLLPNCRTPAACAVQFVRSTPGVTTALVGMKSTDHVTENLAVSEVPPLSEEAFFELLIPHS